MVLQAGCLVRVPVCANCKISKGNPWRHCGTTPAREVDDGRVLLHEEAVSGEAVHAHGEVLRESQHPEAAAARVDIVHHPLPIVLL